MVIVYVLYSTIDVSKQSILRFQFQFCIYLYFQFKKNKNKFKHICIARVFAVANTNIVKRQKQHLVFVYRNSYFVITRSVLLQVGNENAYP